MGHEADLPTDLLPAAGTSGVWSWPANRPVASILHQWSLKLTSQLPAACTSGAWSRSSNRPVASSLHQWGLKLSSQQACCQQPAPVGPEADLPTDLLPAACTSGAWSWPPNRPVASSLHKWGLKLSCQQACCQQPAPVGPEADFPTGLLPAACTSLMRSGLNVQHFTMKLHQLHLIKFGQDLELPRCGSNSKQLK